MNASLSTLHLHSMVTYSSSVPVQQCTDTRLYILTVNCYCKRTYSNSISVLGIEHQDGCCCCPTRLTHFSVCLLSAFVSATRITVLYAVGEGLCDRRPVWPTHPPVCCCVTEAAAFMHKIDLLANQNVCIRFCLMIPALTVFAHLGSWS